MAVSEDLRIRLARKVASGMSRRQAAALFEVSASSAVRYVGRYEDEGTVAVKPRPSRQRRLDPYGEDILRWIKETPDPTLQELSERLDEVHQVIAPTSTINDWFRARKISFKKTAHASEQERADGKSLLGTSTVFYGMLYYCLKSMWSFLSDSLTVLPSTTTFPLIEWDQRRERRWLGN